MKRRKVSTSNLEEFLEATAPSGQRDAPHEAAPSGIGELTLDQLVAQDPVAALEVSAGEGRAESGCASREHDGFQRASPFGWGIGVAVGRIPSAAIIARTAIAAIVRNASE